MTSKADWTVIGSPVDYETDKRLFFDQHEWETIEAASARIIPTDHDPGAREAGVVRFIDRYISGIDYIYASADGSGFLQIEGREADAWRERIAEMQETYREGIRKLDKISQEKFGTAFKDLNEDQQDEVLVTISGRPKPQPISLTSTESEHATFLQGTFDEGMDFFSALALHTRQGYYSDPVYGGNKENVNWKVIGFPGPKSLADTNSCEFSVRDVYVQDFDWADLIPFLKEKQGE
ncbi:gluconate 2-dehydrogenase subunit 3 family protein [Paenibacillus validus]|uniref:Gluconate 2-dehydrogenase subunit 3 family protein n=2 Tax=cellular organisms TaxID=131567 RepID=A0A7X2Z7T2_9BACL|nr:MULTISPECIES: gluconate 2-dehydrogenase subunit 3 family protein [Paenibacillus]MED4601972.1 gluconate 2-dehydrogenase subunit 3 family protein [Paenibacillus validus]MED4608638.1 gluconate 2-dehydrogenase subunit 3 family protein [Paenibacillus validus]MUG69827.1 gluconate 2-dehydrogenase subunit 3 family protein [Paenibacillus validus]